MSSLNSEREKELDLMGRKFWTGCSIVAIVIIGSFLYWFYEIKPPIDTTSVERAVLEKYSDSDTECLVSGDCYIVVNEGKAYLFQNECDYKAINTPFGGNHPLIGDVPLIFKYTKENVYITQMSQSRTENLISRFIKQC